jgi:hypothetical protein
MIRDEVKAEYDRKGQELTRRHLKLFCVAMNEEFGYGKIRLLRAIKRYGDLSAERQDDEIFWYHIDKRLEQMGLDFSKEDYEVMDI